MDIFAKVLAFLNEGISVTENQSKAAGAIGRALVFASEQSGATDDSPGVLTVSEILEGLGAQLPSGK